MSNVAVTENYDERRKLWVYASLWLGTQEAPYAPLSIQSLGYAEKMLLEMEKRLAEMVEKNASRKDREWMLMECSAHSVLWIFGLYEVLRVLKESGNSKFAALEGLFRRLAMLRMPLAKHEVQRIPRNAEAVPHYPTSVWEPETGRVGWSTFGPSKETPTILTRTALPNEFGAIAAVPPAVQPPFPIGGPIGE